MKILPSGIAVLENDSHISKWVEESGKLDHDEYSLGIILPHIKEGDYVVDGGAFIGDHTIAYLKAVGPSGKVYAFEPNPKAFQCLYFNCSQAVTYNYGLSDSEVTTKYSASDNAGAGFVGSGSSGDAETVSLITLDSLNLDRCDFIKLDVEGCEYEALLGAEKTIETHRPTMWIEVNEGALGRNGLSTSNLLALIEDYYGYDTQAYPPERGPQYDLLCTK